MIGMVIVGVCLLAVSISWVWFCCILFSKPSPR